MSTAEGDLKVVAEKRARSGPRPYNRRVIDSSAQTAPKLRGPYAKTAEVRKRIIDACIEVFGEGGFHGATMKEIAVRAGISHTGLLHHFPTKEQLLLEVIAAHDARSSHIVADGGLGTLPAMLLVLRENARRPGLIQLFTILAAEGTVPTHPAHAPTRDRYHDFTVHLTDVFEQLRVQGRVRVDMDSRTLAQVFIATLDGLQIQWLYAPAEVDILGAATKLIDTFVTSEDGV